MTMLGLFRIVVLSSRFLGRLALIIIFN